MSSNGLRQVECIRQVHAKAWREDYLAGWEKIYWLKIKSFYLAQYAIVLGGEKPLASLIRLVVSTALWWIFPDRKELGQPLFFRVRLAVWILKKGH
jgi:hypothetical protein